ncbi:ead/Ea22-like family protein [Citrobacter sp. Igbk 17]|uniref:ead/Ea22-like family protein n=1 Tax=Citrobacter sp. Igbk 17 TaxID=2963957 RepID=UPI002302380F|nr:ead/Ea22-like family protein [Citrobacter sp. Igbk 17]MDA8498749.1 ead/Ea22-like family protein [Citrobacter sp. Igbk 17]
MTALNKQALRSKSRAASAGEWIKESGDGWEAICSSDNQANGNFIIAHFEGPDAEANREFSQAANPDTVLALLDALEAAEKRIAELEARKVNLPAACADDEYFIDGVFQALRYERDVERAIRAAGIGVKGE